MLGIVSLLFGTLVLSVNLVTEYIALNGETPLTELPSWNSALHRTGLTTGYAEFSHFLSWGAYLEDQFSRIGGMIYPYYLLNQEFFVQNHWSLPDLSVLGIIAFASCLIGLIFARHKILLATLLVSGFCWALPMRHHAAFHNYESIFYVGIPMVFFAFCTLGLLWTCSLFKNRMMIVACRFFTTVFAVFIFVLSSFHMSQAGNAEEIIFRKKLSDDFDVVRKIMKNRTILIREEVYEKLYLGGPRNIISYYLAENVIIGERERGFWDHADFELKTDHEQISDALLTPGNELVFLYDKGHS